MPLIVCNVFISWNRDTEISRCLECGQMELQLMLDNVYRIDTELDQLVVFGHK